MKILVPHSIFTVDNLTLDIVFFVYSFSIITRFFFFFFFPHPESGQVLWSESFCYLTLRNSV